MMRARPHSVRALIRLRHGDNSRLGIVQRGALTKINYQVASDGDG